MAVDHHLNGNPKSSTMDGHQQPNGHIRGGRRKPKRKSTSTLLGWSADKLAKLLVWYALITVFLRCPSSPKGLKPDSPQLCKPYLQARDYVLPYAQPYYDQYLAPYAQQAQPYVDQVTAQVVKPGYALYQQHGASRVAEVQKYGHSQWEKTIKPQLDVLQKETGKQYNTHLAPHVKKAQDTVQPYYDNVKTSATDIWLLEVEPVYRNTRPYAEKIYAQGHEFAVKTAIPQAQYFGNTAWTFWTRQIWPKLRILYGENVEPQLLRITERLGRYKDGKKLEAEIKSIELSSKLAEASSSALALVSSLSSTAKEATKSPSSAASAAAFSSSSTPDPKVQFREDLKSWEHICATAVEEGAEDLKERVKEITDSQIKSAEGLGSALVTQLEETVEGVFNSVKASIVQIVDQIPEDPDDSVIEAANDDLIQALRAAGQNIKQRAQAVREWRESAQADTKDLILKAVQSTLETIDNIRELRLTEIGRKYASSSLPHKEWSKYNDLKKATQDWRNDVEKVAQKHSGIAAAKAASDDIEHQAMAIAEDAAKELSRLKDVGKWKIAADDDSEDFSTRHVPPPVRKIKDQVVQKVVEASQAVLGEESEQGTVESVTSVIVEKASQAASTISEAVSGSSTGSLESASLKAAEQVSSLSEKVIGSSTGSVESATSEAAKSAQSIASAVSGAVVGTEPGISDSATDVASSASSVILGTPSDLSDSATDAASSASSAIVGTESGLSDSATDFASTFSSAVIGSEKPAAESFSSSLSSKASDTSKSANTKLSSILSAQKANAESVSSSVGSVASVVSSSASSLADSAVASSPLASSVSKSASSVAKAASSSASSLADVAAGSPPAASKLSNSVSSAAGVASSGVSSVVSAASDALPDADDIADAAQDVVHAATESPKKVFAGANAQVLVEAREPILDDVIDAAGSYSASIQSMASVAGDKASELTQAVQDAIKGLGATPTPGSVESITSVASEQYQSALAAASSVLFGTQNAVEKGSSAARGQYLSAVTAASYAIYGTPATAAPFAAASSAYDNAVSEASKHFEAVKSRVSEQVSGTQKPVQEQMLSSAASAYSGAVSAANQRLQAVVGATTQNAYESVSSAAASRLNDAVSLANAQYVSAKKAVGAEPTPVHQQYFASAQKAYYEALGVAHGRYSEFLEVASGIVSSTPTATALTDRFESAISSARAGYSEYLTEAQSKYSQLSGASSSGNLQKQLADASSIASSKLAQASSDASAAVFGTQPPATESIASRAVENWDALISKASAQVYGQPPPFTDSIASRATVLAGQATDAAASQYSVVQSLFSELVSGKEADFTESVYSRLQSAYSTGAPAIVSQASSYASDAYEQVASAVSAAFVPPTQVPTILEQVQDQLNAAVEGARAQVYGTSKGAFEQATEAAGSVYSDAASQVSEAVYGKETNYLEAAQSNVIDIGASASSAIQAAIYGSPIGTVEVASSAAASVYSSISSQAASQASAASAAVSSAVYGEEQTYLEGVQSQLSAAMASASSQIAQFGAQASVVAGNAASNVGEAVSSATDRIRDEL